METAWLPPGWLQVQEPAWGQGPPVQHLEGFPTSKRKGWGELCFDIAFFSNLTLGGPFGP